MAKAIGPSFGDELKAAGLYGLPFAWGADGTMLYGAGVTDQQKSAIAAVYAAHDPTRPSSAGMLSAFNDAIEVGVGITSSGTPAASGTYSASPQDEINIASLQAAVIAGTFPGFYRDASGLRRAMTATVFSAIAVSVLNYIAACDAAYSAIKSGGSAVYPANTATIP